MKQIPPGIINLACISSKDAPRNVLKKLKQYDLQFYTNCEVEIKACLDKHYLPFNEFSDWLNDAYLRYVIRNVYIYSVQPNEACTEMIEFILTQSIQQLRKVTPELSNPLGLMYTLLAEVWGSVYKLLRDYRPELQATSYCECHELDFNKPVTCSQIIKKHEWLQKQRNDLLNFKYPFEDRPLYPELQAFYLAWLQAILAWEQPETLLKSLFEEITANKIKKTTN